MKKQESADNRRVLIGVISRKKDLAIAAEQGWYRIPVESAPANSAGWLALYQTAGLGPAGKRITSYARILKTTRSRRRTLLPDEKNHPRAGNMYYKLHLGTLQELPRPVINSAAIRMSFGFTTRAKLRKAREIHELFGVKPLELIMARLLRAAGIKAKREHCIMVRKKCRYRLDFAVFCRKGNIDIECDNAEHHTSKARLKQDIRRDRFMMGRGWTVLRFTGADIVDQPETCIRVIKRAIGKLRGTVKSSN